MHARVGDRIVIDGHAVGTAPRRGMVLETAGSQLRVRWDDGRTTLMTPGPDCRVDRSPARSMIERFGARVDLELTEHDGRCSARARFVTGHGVYEATGLSRCHPDDDNMPMVGEELAIGRALRDLSAQLLAEARHHVIEGDAPHAHLLV